MMQSQHTESKLNGAMLLEYWYLLKFLNDDSIIAAAAHHVSIGCNTVGMKLFLVAGI